MSQLWTLIDRRIRQALAAVARPVRGVVSAGTAGQALTATVEARAGEVVEAELAQDWGVASAPPADVEVVAVPVGGSSAHLVIVGELDRSHRPTDLVAGETVVYCATAGVQLRCRPDGTIRLVTPAGAPLGVARLGDTVTLGVDLAAWIVAVSTAAGVPTPASITGTITSSSSTVSAS